MIRLTVNNADELVLEQMAESPSIYLDHWAIRYFSEQMEHSKRLTSALKSANGTLSLSWVNVIEFTRLTDQSQAKAAEQFIDECLPNVFLIEAIPNVVITNEDHIVADETKIAPHADFQLAKLFLNKKPGSLSPLTAHGLFTSVQGHEHIPQIEDMVTAFLEGISIWRNRMDVDRDFAKRVRRHVIVPQSHVIHRPTRYLWLELVRPFLIDRSIKPNRNHVIDFMHAIVPLAYCDIVLLDSHWKTQVDRISSFLHDQPFVMPLAKVFSRKNDGIERFLSELER